MSVVAKAYELGQEIADSEELSDWRESETSVLVDPAASALINEFELKKQALAEARSNGQEPSQEEHKDLVDLHQRMTANPKIKYFIESQNRFQQMIDTVNQILQDAITGKSSCSTGGGCSSCGSSVCGS